MHQRGGGGACLLVDLVRREVGLHRQRQRQPAQHGDPRRHAEQLALDVGLPPMIDHMLATAPKDADVKSWRY